MNDRDTEDAQECADPEWNDADSYMRANDVHDPMGRERRNAEDD